MHGFIWKRFAVARLAKDQEVVGSPRSNFLVCTNDYKIATARVSTKQSDKKK